MSSVFLETNHLFLRAPDGGVEDLEQMVAAGFGAVFCNVKDYPPERWSTVRDRAAWAGAVCGPWARTTNGDDFEPELLDALLEVADAWYSPLIVNSESELKGSGDELTSYIADRCRGREYAVSMEPWPFANVDWRPLADVPVLPQVFGPEWGSDAGDVRAEWQRCGVTCVVHTFGTYSGWTPDLYPLEAPYGLYTADDCGNAFARWSPTGTCNPCSSSPTPPPDTNGGEAMEPIGSQHGVTASVNRLRTLDPAGTLLVADAGGKWPPLSTLEDVPLDKWRAFDKLERSLLELVGAHDELVATMRALTGEA